MTRDEIVLMARKADLWITSDERWAAVVRFANLVAAAERNSAAEIAGDFARKWWSLHCATNKHMETTLMAHNDFCALQSAIRARGEK